MKQLTPLIACVMTGFFSSGCVDVDSLGIDADDMFATYSSRNFQGEAGSNIYATLRTNKIAIELSHGEEFYASLNGEQKWMEQDNILSFFETTYQASFPSMQFNDEVSIFLDRVEANNITSSIKNPDYPSLHLPVNGSSYMTTDTIEISWDTTEATEATEATNYEIYVEAIVDCSFNYEGNGNYVSYKNYTFEDNGTASLTIANLMSGVDIEAGATNCSLSFNIARVNVKDISQDGYMAGSTLKAYMFVPQNHSINW